MTATGTSSAAAPCAGWRRCCTSPAVPWTPPPASVGVSSRSCSPRPMRRRRGGWGERVLERLAGDLERPRIRASVGVAVYPRDGGTAEALLGAADRLLYEMKAQGRRTSP